MLTCGRAAKIPGAGKIEELKDAPGGGSRITIIDPEGFPINLISDQEPAPLDNRPKPEKLVYNFEDEKVRKNKFQRFTEGPAAVHKVSAQHYLATRNRKLTHINSLVITVFAFKTSKISGDFTSAISILCRQIGCTSKMEMGRRRTLHCSPTSIVGWTTSITTHSS
jgi:hypothetical protein